MTDPSESAVVDRIREMAAREQECCAFMKFNLREDADGILLVIEAPETSRDMLDAVIAPFHAPERTNSGCGCSSTACR